MTYLTPKDKKVALFDVCRTLVEVTTLNDFTENFLLSRRLNPKFSWFKYINHLPYKFRRRLRIIKSKIYHQHLLDLFRGYSESDLLDIIKIYTLHLNKMVRPVVLGRLQELQRNDYDIYLVTGGLDVYLKLWAQHLKVGLICTELSTDTQGRFTGKVIIPECIGQDKVEKIKNKIKDFDKIDWSVSYAFGDSLSDIPMLELVGHPVAVCPEDDLFNYAKVKGWLII